MEIVPFEREKKKSQKNEGNIVVNRHIVYCKCTDERKGTIEAAQRGSFLRAKRRYEIIIRSSVGHNKCEAALSRGGCCTQLSNLIGVLNIAQPTTHRCFIFQKMFHHFLCLAVASPCSMFAIIDCDTIWQFDIVELSNVFFTVAYILH